MMKQLVLVGAGHAHARVLLEFARQPAAEYRLVLISPELAAPYSGMVPGWLAGHYPWEACCVDFGALSRRARADILLERAVGIDPAGRQLKLASGRTLHYDLLSLDIGSTLEPPLSQDDERDTVLPMRPLSALNVRWHALLERLQGWPAGKRVRVAMIGGGAAGVESVLSAAHRLRALAPHLQLEFCLATHGDAILPGLAAGAGRRLLRHLADARIDVQTGFSAQSIEDGGVRGSDGRVLEAEIVLWATGAQPWRWPGQSGLACDARGFIQVDACLRSTSHPDIFAAGDCAGFAPPLPKAGVYAVRMGPVLAHNLRTALRGDALKSYRPQRRFLVLIGTGGPHAVASWGPFSWEGDRVWRWKQRIDRRFVLQHTGC